MKQQKNTVTNELIPVLYVFYTKPVHSQQKLLSFQGSQNPHHSIALRLTISDPNTVQIPFEKSGYSLH